MILKGHNVRDPGPRIQNYQVSSRISRRKLKAITIKVKTSHFKFHLKVGTMKSNGDIRRAVSENHLFM